MDSNTTRRRLFILEFLLKVLMVEENLRLDFAKLLVCQYKFIFNGRYKYEFSSNETVNLIYYNNKFNISKNNTLIVA